VTIDRRDFLRYSLGAAGAVVLQSCRKAPTKGGGSPGQGAVELPEPSPPSLLPADHLPPAPRIILRSADEDFGFPWPYSYLPPVYGRLTLIYDTLLHRDSTGAFLPWLASSYKPSADGLTHTFQLRDNIKWSDGQPFSSDDVVFTFEYFKANLTTPIQKTTAPKIPPFLLFKPDYVQSVRALGPNGVEFRLDRPAVTFASDVAGRVLITPRHIWSKIDPPGANRADLKALVGTGPYKLEIYSQGGSRYVANDDFFLGKPFVKRLDIITASDQLAALKAGKTDSAGFTIEPTNSQAIRPLLRDRKFGYSKGVPDFTVGLYWNLTKPPFSDVRFRQAIARALDRNAIVRRLLGGNGVPGNPGFLPPEHPFRVEVEQYPFDKDSSEKALDELGYERGKGGIRTAPGGKPFKPNFTVDPSLASLAELLDASFRQLGIQVEIDPKQEFSIKDYDMALFFHGGLQEDPDIMRKVYSKSAAASGQSQFFSVKDYSNPEFEDLADRQLVTLDEAKRKELIARMQQIVAADLPLLHLYYPSPFEVFRKAAFDHFGGHSRTPDGKTLFVTGVATGGTKIRPISGE